MTNLKKAREKKGISQKTLAKILEISAPRYNQYENKKRSIPPDIAIKISKILNISFEDIYN